MPAPASPASIAASIVLTLRRDPSETVTSFPRDQNRHVLCADTLPNEMTSREAKSSGTVGDVRVAR